MKKSLLLLVPLLLLLAQGVSVAEAIKLAPKLNSDTIIIVNSCGDAHKDRDILKQRLGKI